MQSVRKSVRCAVCIIPPNDQWEPIQDIRRLHDKAFDRWMPHINLLYPFVEEEELSSAVTRLRMISSKVQEFDISLTPFGHFSQPKSMNTVHLTPENGRSELQQLHKELMKLFPGYDDLVRRNVFSPHLTVGQIRGNARILEATKIEWNRVIKPFVFTLRAIHVITRTGSSPFVISATVPLQRSGVPRPLPATDTQDTPEGKSCEPTSGRTDSIERADSNAGNARFVAPDALSWSQKVTPKSKAHHSNSASSRPTPSQHSEPVAEVVKETKHEEASDLIKGTVELGVVQVTPQYEKRELRWMSEAAVTWRAPLSRELLVGVLVQEESLAELRTALTQAGYDVKDQALVLELVRIPGGADGEGRPPTARVQQLFDCLWSAKGLSAVTLSLETAQFSRGEILLPCPTVAPLAGTVAAALRSFGATAASPCCLRLSLSGSMQFGVRPVSPPQCVTDRLGILRYNSSTKEFVVVRRMELI